MIGKLAKMTVEKWWMEGLNPTFEDIVLLNGLAVKVENNAEAFDFASVPRVAFLGDNCLWEPTVAKKIWMDAAVQLIADNYISHLVFTVFALNCPAVDLPSISDSKQLTQMMNKCQEEIVNNYTETQILGAIRYVLKGDNPDADAEWIVKKDGNKEDFYSLPSGLKSQAKQILAEAVTYGMDVDIKDEVTLSELERMVTVAAMHSGKDVLKDDNAQRVGAFYAAAGTIHTRLMKEKENGKK